MQNLSLKDLVDAFSGDSIPAHLLTTEAIELYLGAITEDGSIVVHISNRFFDFQPVIARLASSDDVAYDYLVESILDWPDQVTLARTIAGCGWEHVAHRNLTGGIVALHRARKPLA